MKILEFFQESNNKFSSKRLMSFFAVIGIMVDWMHAIFNNADNAWHPDWQTIAFVAVVLGYQTAVDIFKK